MSLAVTRRRFLVAAGGVAAGAAGGVCLGRAWPCPGDAYDAWATWRDAPPGCPERLVRAAVLAASPHNSQPWLFAAGAGTIDLLADERRWIGAPDPLRRELYIGVGCALENLVIAASAEGLAARVTPFPGPDPAHVARVDLRPAEIGVDPLHEAIPRRHTDRGPYEPRGLPSRVFDALGAIVADGPVRASWLRSPAQLDSAREQIVAATEAMIADGQTADSARWLRANQKDIREHRDGITIDASGASAFVRVLARILPAPSPEAGDRYWRDAVRDVQAGTAPAFGLLSVERPDDRAQLVACGRAWQRMHLWATTRGIAMQPLNQLPERDAREQALGLEPRFGRALSAMSGDAHRRVVLMFRLGYGTRDPLPSPRRDVHTVLRSGVAHAAVHRPGAVRRARGRALHAAAPSPSSSPA